MFIEFSLVVRLKYKWYQRNRAFVYNLHPSLIIWYREHPGKNLPTHNFPSCISKCVTLEGGGKLATYEDIYLMYESCTPLFPISFELNVVGHFTITIPQYLLSS